MSNTIDTITLRWSAGPILLSMFVAFMGSYGCITLYEQYRICARSNNSKLASPFVLLLLMVCSVGGK
jgi:hypothetical protein